MKSNITNLPHQGMVKVLAVLLVVMMMITNAAPVLAVGTNIKGTMSNTYLGKGSDGKYYYNPHYAGTRSFKFQIKSGSKYYAGYCINANQRAKSGTGYISKSTASSKFKGLPAAARKYVPLAMIYGWQPGKSAPVAKTNAADYYIATQIIIWEFDTGARKSPTSGRSSNSEYKSISGRPAAKVYNKILSNMAKHGKGASFTRSTRSAAKTYKMKYSYGTKKFSIKLPDQTKANYLKATGKGGNSIVRSGWNYTFSRSSAGSSTVSLKNNIKLGTSQPLMIWQATKSTADNQGIAMGATDDTEFYAKFTTEKTGIAKIIKTSEDGKVAGIKFNISGNGLNKTFTTDSKGVIAENIYPGKYLIKEVLTTAQAQIYKPQAPQKVVITEGKTATVNFKNESLTDQEFSIQKITDDGLMDLSGFTFHVKGVGADGKVITAADVLAKSDAKGGTDLAVNSADLDKINGAIAKGDTGSYQVKISGKVETVDSGGNPITEEAEKTITVYLRHVKDTGTTTITPDAGSGLTANDFDYAGSASKVDKNYTTNQVGFITDEIPNGTFEITEVMTKDQSDRYRQPQSQTVTVSKDNPVASVIFENKAKKGDLKIIKTSDDDIIESIPFSIEGTTAWGDNVEPIQVETDANGVISDSTKGLSPGTYTITELDLDASLYMPQKPQIVKISDGKTKEVKFHNKLKDKKIEISKESATTGKELPGAELQIIDPETKEVVKEWTSSNKPYVITDLEWGKTYLLHEDLNPLGYRFAQDIEFTVGTDHKVTMVDEANEVLIAKKDAVTKKQLPGAILQLLDGRTGKVIKEFKSGQEMQPIQQLIPGYKYILHEKTAPKGYKKAKDIKFVMEDNKVITMYDKPTGKVVVSTDDQYGNGPRTGDETTLWPILLLVAMAGTVMVLSYKSRHKNEFTGEGEE